MPICTTCGHSNREAARFCDACGAALDAAPPREQRKVVTVLFCDVVGSTALGEQVDPEALRALLARYFARMKEIVERHGGTVEKFIGDAVMAVFGVPVVHEDDALRALRAAEEMCDALAELGVGGRIGVNTGEVVVGTEERLATGDAVNVAARLEQAAEVGAVLVGDETLRRVRDAVEVEAVPPIALKGKTHPVRAHRLLRVVAEAPSRRTDAPLVGRVRERRLLADAWERVRAERSCQLFTLLGAAGVGKSRLVREFLADVDGARVVRGRCLSYGEGITYWPVVEVLKQLGRPEEYELDAAAREPLLSLLGEDVPATTPEETAWAFRKLVEAAAPVVAVFDDIHWGEETFLDLVEHVADLSRDAPILLLCLARPELLDRRSGWGGGKLNATTVLLEPLARDETDELIDRLLIRGVTDDLRARIHAAADGNPLFVEEMLALIADGAPVEVPPTIQALLAARLDQLSAAERNALECGAVEGKVFHRGAVAALGADVSQLNALVRKELIRSERAQVGGEEAYRFRHQLIRDAAYDSLPKTQRARLHERFAEWLEARGGIAELDEILGHHLEHAYRNRVDIAGLDDDSTHLAARACKRLGTAGMRAQERGDAVAAAELLERAVALGMPGRDRADLLLHLVSALQAQGRFADAREFAEEASAEASAAGDRIIELRADLMVENLRVQAGELADRLATLVAEALPIFHEAQDERAMMLAWSMIAGIEHDHCRFGARNAAFERALVHARRLRDVGAERNLISFLAAGYVAGPTPVTEALRWCDAHASVAPHRPPLIVARARLEAMLGHFDDARARLAQARERVEELGAVVAVMHATQAAFYVEMLAGDAAAAARAADEACDNAERVGAVAAYSTLAAQLGQAHVRLGRDTEAEQWTRRSQESGAADDVLTQVLWRQVRALVLARRGEHAQAERLAREAVATIAQTDMLTRHGDALLDLADVLSLAGVTDEAVARAAEALALHERKGDVVSAERTRARLTELRISTPTS